MIFQYIIQQSADIKQSDKMSKALIDIDQWIEYLDQKEQNNQKKYTELFQWAATKKPLSVLNQCIANYSWRTSNGLWVDMCFP